MKEHRRRMETAEMHFLRVVMGYRMIDHKHNKDIKYWRTVKNRYQHRNKKLSKEIARTFGKNAVQFIVLSK
jgi:isocitrate dehydrogenase kinase/phosphatase